MSGVSFTAYLKDHFSGALQKLSSKSDSAYKKINSTLGRMSTQGRVVGQSIDDINRRLDQLTRRRDLAIDTKSIRAANREIAALSAKRDRLENGGSTRRGMGFGIKGMALAAAYSAGRYINSAIQKYDVGSKADAQLEAGIKSTGGIAGQTTQGLVSQAGQLQKTTLFDDEATKGLQSVLLTFTKVRGEVFQKAVPLIQDMATRMGTDLNSAAMQVGKALNMPIMGITALNRAGVQFSETQKKQIKNFVALGQTEKAQAIILQELNTQFGGSAAAAAKAGTGGMTILKHRIDDLQESAGKTIYKGVGPMASALGNLAAGAMKMTESNVVTDLMVEKEMFIELARAAGSNNITQERRIQLLRDMKNLQPEFLKGLEVENATLDQIKTSLLDTLSYYDKKISYMKTQTIVANELNKAEEYTNTLMDLRQAKAVGRAGSFEQQVDSWNMRANALGFMKGLMNNNNDVNRVLSGGVSQLLESQLGPMIDEQIELTEKQGESHLKLQTMRDEYIKLLQVAGQLGDKTDQATRDKLAAAEKSLLKYGNVVGITQSAIDKLKASFINPDGTTTEGPGGSAGGGDNTDADGLSSVSGDTAKAKNINISIEKLVENITINTATVKESQGDIEEAISKALLTAVNDANRVAG